MALTTSATLAGFPDAQNTGVRDGVTLKVVGDLIVTTPGAVISGLEIHGTLRIEADNVTVRDCKIINDDSAYNGILIPDGNTGAVVEYCDIIGAINGISGAGTFRFNDFDSNENGINVYGPSLIQDNYIHNMSGLSNAHYDGIEINGGGGTTIRHNTIINENGQTSGVMIDNYFGAVSGIIIDNNYIAGGGYTIYSDGGFSTTEPITGVQITNNYLGQGYWGYYAFKNNDPLVSGNHLLGTIWPTPVSGGGTSTVPQPSAPVIASFSNDTGKVGDGITSDNTLQLKGTAAANSTIKVYDNGNQIGTATANSSGSWEYITNVLTNAKHSLTATVVDSSGQTSAQSGAVTVTVDTVAPTAPAVSGNTIVNTNQVKLSGTAEANSTVTFYDGNAVVGTGTANSSGVWSITTNALSTGSHALTAKATDAAGNVSGVSQSISAVISVSSPAPDTVAPTAPLVSSNTLVNTNQIKLSGTAEANSTVTIYDGNAVVGTGITNSTGVWSITTNALSTGSHTLMAKAVDAAGNISAASQSLSAAISVSSPAPDTVAPIAPVVGSNTLINTNQVKLSGTAEANSTVTIYDGDIAVGTGITSPAGAWSVTTIVLSAGAHTLTAKATDAAGNTGAPSTGILASIGTGTSGPPASPNPGKTIESAGATDLVEIGDKFYLNSSSGSGPSLKYRGADFVDGTDGKWTPIGAEKTATGYLVAWKETSTGLYTAWNTDNNGNYVSHVSGLTGSVSGGSVSGTNGSLKAFETSLHQDLNGDGQIRVSPTPEQTSSIGITSMNKGGGSVVTLQGGADINSIIKLYDGNASLGTVKTAADGTWKYETSSAVSDSVHIYTAKQIDGAGKVVETSGNAILGSTGNNTLKSSSGNDFFVGNGGIDTFVFASNFGKDVIKDFVAAGRSHDVIEFSKTTFDSFASVLSHASQVDQDVVISSGNDTLTLKNTKLSSLNSGDFHFA